MIVMIDNYCSFTYNQVHYFGDLGIELQLYRNDQITIDELKKLNIKAIIISSGPCTPNEAGISLPLIEYFGDKIPLFGICLGHQSMGQAFGGNIVHAKQVMHGKLSAIYHSNHGVFKGLPNPFQAVRYHSLVVDQQTLPKCLEVTAWTQTANGDVEEIMGIRHREWTAEGVQFHPESILTEHGHTLLKNFLKNAKLL